MNKFIKKQPIKEIKPLKRNNHLRLKGLGVFLMVLLALTFALLIKEYIDTHTFVYRSPILFQKPVIIERIKIISPLASKSASLGQAYAEELPNPYDVRSPKGIAWELVKEKWGIDQWNAFEELIERESSWNPYSVNQSSGACFLPQALPCSKMGVEAWDYEGQLKWAINYIQGRYVTPTQALQFHDRNNYY